jgi:hypothetical protein
MNPNRDWSTYDNPTEPQADTRDELIAHARMYKPMPIETDENKLVRCQGCNFIKTSPDEWPCNSCKYCEGGGIEDCFSPLPKPQPASSDTRINQLIQGAEIQVDNGKYQCAQAMALIAIAKLMQKEAQK